MKHILVELKDVVKRFGNVVAVRNVSLQIEEGEAVVLLGPSGCGKTTTLRLIAGLLHPDEGRILIAGKEVGSANTRIPPDKRQLSMVFQSYAVWPHKTVSGNIAYGLKLRGLGRNEIYEKVKNSLKLVKMQDLGDRYPSELSGGQQQRVALARALVLEPKILLLDEPLSNLDATLREEMRFEIRELQKRLGITTIYVTHDQEEAMVIADRLIVMNSGRVEQSGSPEEIYRYSKTKFVCGFIGLANIISGEIVRINYKEQMILLKCDLGSEVKVNCYEGQIGSIKIGDSVSFYVRPEDIAVSIKKLDGENNVFAGNILNRTFLGTMYDFRIRVGEVELRVQTNNLEESNVGVVYLYLNPERCWVLVN